MSLLLSYCQCCVLHYSLQQMFLALLSALSIHFSKWRLCKFNTVHVWFYEESLFDHIFQVNSIGGKKDLEANPTPQRRPSACHDHAG